MQKHIKIRLFFLVFSIISFIKISNSQSSEHNFSIPFIEKNKYLNYLFYSDSNTQASLLYVKYQYLYMQKSKPFRSGGMHLSVGLNIARFFSKKIILGICYDFKVFPGYTKQYFTSNFVNDYNANYISTYNNNLDSIRSNILFKTINSSNNYRIRGSALYNFGIAFSPFPQKFGGILLQLTKSGCYYPFYGSYPTEKLTKDNEPINLKLANNYSVELSFKPYNFINSKRINVLDHKIKELYKFIVISFYYQHFTLDGATFNNVSLSKFVNQPFIDRYSNQNYFGIKLGLGLY